MITRKWQKFERFFENADCQLHTNYTDGKSSPEEYFYQAEKNGLDFILFSEHVRRVTTYDYLKFKEHVYRAGAKSKIKFAVGAEAKVLSEHGDIDISNDIAKEAEMILFSFHTPDFKSVESYYRAIKNASLNPMVDVFAHPTFYHNWQKMEVSFDWWCKILEILQYSNVCYEFNRKYPIPAANEIMALKQVDVQYIFGSDAHEHHTLLSKGDIHKFRSLVD